MGKRRYERDWGRRLWFFDSLILSVLSYGVDIWERKERKEMEGLEERYLKWMLAVERRTPSYMIRKELHKTMLRRKAEIRAVNTKKG